MKTLSRQLVAVFFLSLLLPRLFAAAPVVDDSENFAVFDEQQAGQTQPVQAIAHDRLSYDDPDSDIAFAKEDSSNIADATELLDKLNSLQQEIQELRGQLEIQSHELQQLKQQQLSFYRDVDDRLQHGTNHPASNTAAMNQNGHNSFNNPQNPANPPVSTTKPQLPSTNATKENSASPVAVAPAAVRTNPAEEQISYLAAYDLVKNKHFDEALIAMQNFTAKYPQGGYTANAEYWLGELYLVKKNYALAVEHFETVLKHFPNSSKAAACSLKIGYALAASGQKTDAKARLQQVIKNYPDTPTAQLAAAKLRSINAS